MTISGNKQDPIITKNNGKMIINSKFDQSEGEKTFTIEIDFTPEGEASTYKSEVKFYIDYEKEPPQAAISLIEAKPQRQGLGKLLMYMVAHVGNELGLKNISTIMNTPEEKMFYSSVGLEVPQEEIEKYKKSFENEGLSSAQISAQLELAKDRLNRTGATESVKSKTKDSVNTTLDERSLTDLHLYLSDISSNARKQIQDKKVSENRQVQDIVKQLVADPRQITPRQFQMLNKTLTNKEKEQLRGYLDIASKNPSKPNQVLSPSEKSTYISPQKEKRYNPLTSLFKVDIKQHFKKFKAYIKDQSPEVEKEKITKKDKKLT